MSVGEWEFQKLRTAAELDARPLALPPETAQKWCNFILFVPGRLPDDCVLRNGSVRREAPAGRVGGHTAGRTPWSENNPSAYRYEVVGAGRRLRIKQFLYDWAFPALGHPSLWKSSTRATPIDEQHVLWFGTDYMGNTGASARIGRTMVELSVLEGEFNDDDILGLYRSLDPADEGAASAIADTRFSALSYWARRPESPVISVPLGLWRIRQSGLIRMSWLADGEADKLGACTGAPSALAGLRLDSGAKETGEKDWTEAEVLYSGGSRRETELRLHLYRRSPTESAPERDEHPGRFERLTVGGRPVHLAWIDQRYGPFDALMEGPSGALRLRLLSGTGVGCNREWFIAALEELSTQDGLL